MKHPYMFIRQLSPEDAVAILNILASSDEQMAIRIVEIAKTYLGNVNVNDIAAALYTELDCLKVEEIWDRAGPTRHGYVAPEEVAESMLDDALKPYLSHLSQLQALRLDDDANNMCRGLLLGLFLFEHESTSEFKDWVPDLPKFFTSIVLEAWQAGDPKSADVARLKTFVEAELNGWIEQ